MKKTKSFPLLAAVAAATALAATVTAAPAGATRTQRSQAISCSEHARHRLLDTRSRVLPASSARSSSPGRSTPSRRCPRRWA